MPGAGLGQNVFFAKTLSFRLSFCYRFGLRFSFFVYVEASMQCDKKMTTRWAGSKWTAWLLASLDVQQLQLGSFTAWQLGCATVAASLLDCLLYSYRFLFFLIVLPWFGHVKGRFGHKRKVPGVFLQSQI